MANQTNQSSDSRAPQVMRLNNSYTNAQLRRQMRALTPRRRYLGLILVTVVAVLIISAYGLMSSYQGFKNAQTTNSEAIQQSSQAQYQASSDAQMIKNMQNSFYAQKYARSQFYSLPGEKIFTVPSSSTTTTNIGD